MPIIAAETLEDTIRRLLAACGTPADEAETVARHVVDANLCGHDSHGAIQIPIYIDRVEKGHIVPGAPFEIVRESPTTTVVDGHWGFGYAIAERALKLTMEKAEAQNVAACTIFRQSHVGRLGAYPTMAAKAGFIAMMTADSGRSAKSVAPFGGAEARLGTNPIAMAVPSARGEPVLIDMATSAVAAGKIKLAQARGKPIPEGWIVRADGGASTDPNDFGNGAVLLPLGGSEGHKGYGLSAMVEILSGLLTGLGFGVEPTGRHNDGCFLALFKAAAFRDPGEFGREVDEFVDYLKGTRVAAGFEEVLAPGEIERRNAEPRRANGIDIEDATWNQFRALGEKYGVAVG